MQYSQQNFLQIAGCVGAYTKHEHQKFIHATTSIPDARAWRLLIDLVWINSNLCIVLNVEEVGHELELYIMIRTTTA